MCAILLRWECTRNYPKKKWKKVAQIISWDLLPVPKGKLKVFFSKHEMHKLQTLSHLLRFQSWKRSLKVSWESWKNKVIFLQFMLDKLHLLCLKLQYVHLDFTVWGIKKGTANFLVFIWPSCINQPYFGLNDSRPRGTVESGETSQLKYSVWSKI